MTLFSSFEEKQIKLESEFSICSSQEEIYHLIIAWGRKLPPMDPSLKTKELLVSGCQSEMFLQCSMEKGRLYFSAASDALISAGLAALLLYVYNGEPPEVLLKCPPRFLDTAGIRASLTPSRSGGLSSIFLHMQRASLNYVLLGRSI